MTLQIFRRVLHDHQQLCVFVVISVTVIGLIGTYSFWSLKTWEAYRLSYGAWQKELRTDTDTAVTLPTANQAQRSQKTAALEGISSDIIAAKRSLCAIHVMVRWQVIIIALKEREDTCHRVVETASSLGEKIQTTTKYLENEQVLVGIITAASNSQASTTEATWQSQVETWGIAVEAIKKMSVEPAFIPVKDGTLSATQSVATAWQNIVVAHKAKDKAKYVEAQTRLADAYDALRGVVSHSHEFTKLADSLQAAYGETFGFKP